MAWGSEAGVPLPDLVRAVPNRLELVCNGAHPQGYPCTWLGLVIVSSPAARRSRVHEPFVNTEVHAGLVRFFAVAL